MKTLEINPRFAAYFRALDYGQEQQLEKSLRDDLTSEPILWWHNTEADRDEILDGHHRYRIASRLKIELQTHEKFFESEDEALLFIIRIQTTRRNLDNREATVREVVALEIKFGKTKTEAVQGVAAEFGVAESTIWEDIKPKSEVQQFFEDKKVYERDLERVRNKEVDKLKRRAQKEGWSDDEDKLDAEWQTLEAEIQTQFAEQTAKLESASEVIQAEAEASGVKVGGGKGKGGHRGKKATRNAAIRSIKGYLSKIQDLSYHFGEDFVPIDFAACAAWVAKIEPAKKRFGR